MKYFVHLSKFLYDGIPKVHTGTFAVWELRLGETNLVNSLKMLPCQIYYTIYTIHASTLRAYCYSIAMLRICSKKQEEVRKFDHMCVCVHKVTM